MNTRLITALVIVLSFFYQRSSAQLKKTLRKDVFDAIINSNVKVIQIQEIAVPEGQKAPKHFHPCPVLGYVKSGRVLFQIEGGETKILREGDVFYEPKGKTILHFDNPSEAKPLIFVAFYLKEQDEVNVKILSEP